MGLTRYRSAAALAVLLAVARVATAQDVATQRQSDRTEQANREAAVADEASKPPPAHAPARDPAAGARTSPATLSYGPVLTPRGQQGAAAVRKDPAEVHDEADTLARQTAHPQNTQLTDNVRGGQRDDQRGNRQGTARGGQHGERTGNKADGRHGDDTGDKADAQRGEQAAKPTDEQRRRAARRHQAWQPTGPMAPRPLRAGEAPATAAEPIPPPLAPPQPVVPSSSAVRACQGIVCTDAAGNTFNGSGNAGVGSGGRTCTRTGATVQCF